MADVYRFKFDPSVPLEEAELTLQLALVAAEGLYGEARLRVDGGYFVNEDRRTISVDASTTVGQSIVNIYSGFLMREYGSDAFKVSRDCRRGDQAASATSAEQFAQPVAV